MATIKLKVLEYIGDNPIYFGLHICEDEQGNKHRVDLMVDGAFEVSTVGYEEFVHKTLIGKEIECELQPFTEIAGNIKCVALNQPTP